jgi:hypothetical protein
VLDAITRYTPISAQSTINSFTSCTACYIDFSQITNKEKRMKVTIYLLAIILSFGLMGCDDDDSETEADLAGVGAACTTDDQCQQPEDDAGPVQECLTEFTGGYCGVKDCASNEDCPEGSVCVDHDGTEYCFRICNDKPECNANRDEDVESNCVGGGSVDYVDPTTPKETKACVPPSSGV